MDWFIQAEEHGKRGKEVDTVKDRADGVHGEFVVVRIIGDGGDGPRLHERSEHAQDKHDAGVGNKLGSSGFALQIERGLSEQADGNVGQRVVEAKVGVGDEVKKEGHAIQLNLDRERVRRAEHVVEIMSPKVIADVGKDRDPHVALDPVTRGAPSIKRRSRIGTWVDMESGVHP